VLFDTYRRDTLKNLTHELLALLSLLSFGVGVVREFVTFSFKIR